MATRLYLPSSGAAAVNPSFSSWTETAGADRLRCVTTRVGSSMLTKVRAHTANGANSRFLSRMYVSDTLAAQTIAAGTVKGTIRVLESGTNDNLNAMVLAVRVVSNDGLTFRSPSLYGPANGTVAEFNTSLRAKRLAAGAATNAVTVFAGDRLVIEIGTTTTVGGVSLSDTISYGDNSATDLGDNETDTAANNPFVELSQTVLFSTAYTATVATTLGAVSESTSKTAAHPRTVAATLPAFGLDSATAVVAPAPANFIRNAETENIVAIIDEIPTYRLDRVRTSGESVGFLDDAASVVKVIQRTTSAALATLTEAAVRAPLALARTATQGSWAGFLWGTTPWGSGFYGDDSVFTLGEAILRGASTFGRTATATIGSLAEAVVGVWTEYAQHYLRNADDTLGAMTEAASGILTAVGHYTATLDDTLGAMSESILRGASTFGRSVSDSVATLTETVVKGFAQLREAADSLPSLAEIVERSSTWVRTSADTVGATTEAVVRGAITKTRDIADSLSSLAEVVTRASTWSRVAADATGAIAETVVGIRNTITRAVTDTVGAISEMTARQGTLGRSADGAIDAIAEAVERAGTFARTVAATIGSLVESVANGEQLIGGVPPVIRSALHSIARGLGYAPKPDGSAHHDKPRD